MTYKEFVEKHGLHISDVHAIGARTGATDCGKGARHFRVTISLGGGASLWRGEYTVGAAHPITWANEGCKVPDHIKSDKSVDVKARHALRQMDHKPKFSGAVTMRDDKWWQMVLARFDALAPIDVVDILQSLAMDAGCSDETFGEWCANYGYSDDSIKARATFDACRDIGATLRRNLGHVDYSELMECEE